MNCKTTFKALAVALAFAPALLPRPALAQEKAAPVLPYQNPALSARQRAADLCCRLTLEEKAQLMMDRSPAIPRLGIPQFEWWNEALHGVARNGKATVFPITMAMAASWNPGLVYEVFTAVSDEGRAKNSEARRTNTMKRYAGLSFWTPNINIFRDPRWGRGQETYGEDPYLTTCMGLAVVRGLQGQPMNPEPGIAKPRYAKAFACAKHFAVHSGPEWNRHSFNLTGLPARDLWETYLPAFKALVTEGDVKEVMCAYQRIDGEPCCGNKRYLQQILRDEWGFKGLVTSDCGAVSDFWKPGYHEFLPTSHESAARAVASGTDVECGSNYRSLPQAVSEGHVTEQQIDTSLKRLLQARFELGDFDSDSLVEWARIPMSVVACAEHKQMALEAARQSVVMLANDGTLPLAGKMEGIVVMGPNANDSTMQWGNYNGFPTHTVTIWQGIKHLCPTARLIEGCGYLHNDTLVTPQGILREVGDAHTVIFCGGISPRLEGEQMKVKEAGFRGGDRTSIELPQAQRLMIETLHKAGKKVVYVNCSGSAIALVPEKANSNAMLQAWYGGEAGGQAVAEVLFGVVNPSGKLPVTFYKSTEQLPPYEDYRMAGRTYRYFKQEPLFAFGHGLSYTTFSLGKPRYAGGRVLVDVTNVGKRDGDEVVQVYVRNPLDNEGPLKTLRGFQRVSVKAGQTVTVSIDMPRDKFELWDSQSNTMRVVPGTYDVMVGNSSDSKALQTISVTLP